MKEKILSAIENKIKNLARNQEQAKEALQNIKVVGQSIEKNEIEDDLKKIETEMKNAHREMKYVQKLFEVKEKYENVLSKQSKLLEEKSKYEKILSDLSGKYSITDGKLGKTQEQKECENDLAKINAELKSIEFIENELNRTNRKIKTFMDKYKIKETETKETETKETETKETETKETETKETETKETETKDSKQKQQRKPIAPDAKNVKIQFIAKEDAYVVENLENGETIWINRKDLKETDKEILAEKTGKNVEDLEYVDTNVLRVLMNYNKDLARKYFKEVTTMGKSRENRLKDMKSIGLEINYDLRGLYEKFPGDELDSKSVDAFSLEERRFLLDNANKAKDMGSATVKKGLKVKLFEKIDQFKMKFTRKNLLNMGSIKDYGDNKLENSDKDDNKEQRGFRKLRTKEVVNEPYGLQQDVLDKLEQLKVDEETKKKLDEVVEQHKDEETKSEETHRLTPDEYEVIEPGSER